MRKNKRGQVFAIILFFMTLFMIFLSIFLYLNQQKKMYNTIVSPFDVLEIRDERDIFEYTESAFVKENACDLKDAWDANVFEQELLDDLLDLGDDCFVLNDLSGELANLEKTAPREVLDSFYIVSKEGPVVTVNREARKGFELEPELVTDENSFPVQVEWVYKKEYKINLDDC